MICTHTFGFGTACNAKFMSCMESGLWQKGKTHRAPGYRQSSARVSCRSECLSSLLMLVDEIQANPDAMEYEDMVTRNLNQT